MIYNVILISHYAKKISVSQDVKEQFVQEGLLANKEVVYNKHLNSLLILNAIKKFGQQLRTIALYLGILNAFLNRNKIKFVEFYPMDKNKILLMHVMLAIQEMVYNIFIIKNAKLLKMVAQMIKFVQTKNVLVFAVL